MAAKNKTAISFGLVHIPVKLFLAQKQHDIGFNLLHTKCKERIKYQKYCTTCDEEIENNEIVKGYEYEPEAYVTFDEQELAELKAPRNQTIEIVSFVIQAEIDPIYYEKTYFLTANGSEKAFSLLKAVLEKEKKVAIAKTVIGFKDQLVALRFGYGGILMSTLFFENELRLENPVIDIKLSKEELAMASKLVASMSGEFQPEDYQDEYLARVEKAIDEKLAGKKITTAKNKAPASIDNLMEALQASIKTGKK